MAMTKTYEFINLDYLELMVSGDLDMKKTMIEMLLNELGEEINKMRPMYQAKNLDDLYSLSHKMKSTLSFVGNEEMISTNKEIEHRLKNNLDSSDLPKFIEVLEQLYPKVEKELKIEFNTL